MERQHELEISQSDADRRGIANGERVRLFNQRGEIFLRAKVDGDLPAGVVGARLGWAKLAPDGVNINVLTSDALTDLGAGATFYSTLVDVERSPETSSATVG
jgi:anaerobic selenocysteine-containing dehydrogenase